MRAVYASDSDNFTLSVPLDKEGQVAAWCYGALLDYWSRWTRARVATLRNRPRRRGTLARWLTTSMRFHP